MLLDARDNPFVSTDGGFDMPFTSNENKTKEPLKRVTITIPSQARVIKKVTVEFKNLDGSIESKSIDLDNAVDWHLPLFISQKYTQSSPIKLTPKRIIKKVPIQKVPIKKPLKYKKIGLTVATHNKIAQSLYSQCNIRAISEFRMKRI